MATNKTEKIEIENVNHPGHVTLVDADNVRSNESEPS